MNKRELAGTVAQVVHLPATTVARVIQATMEQLVAALAKTGRLEYRDLGTFTVESYPPRQVRLPSGKVVELPARKLVRLKPSGTLMRKAAPPPAKERKKNKP